MLLAPIKWVVEGTVLGTSNIVHVLLLQSFELSFQDDFLSLGYKINSIFFERRNFHSYQEITEKESAVLIKKN